MACPSESPGDNPSLLLFVSNGGAEGKEDKDWLGWKSVPIWLRSGGWLATFVGKAVSGAQPGLINQVGLGDSETLAVFMFWGDAPL